MFSKLRQRSALAGGRVAEVEDPLAIAEGGATHRVGDDEEAVSASVEVEPGRVGSVAENGPELLIAGAGEDKETRVIGCSDDRRVCDVVRRLLDEREARLVAVVRYKEVASRGGTAPRLADGAAAERVPGRQPDEYLPDDDRLRQVAKDSRAALVRHGVINRRMPDQPDLNKLACTDL
jgi:hypothetical protein